MAKWIVSGTMTISVHTVVEAASADEAMRLAQDRGVQGLCHQCAGGHGHGRRSPADEEWRTSGELDGEPENLQAEEM